jgi:hypothetical protein
MRAKDRQKPAFFTTDGVCMRVSLESPASKALSRSPPNLQTGQRRTKRANDRAAVRTFKLRLCSTP